MGVDAMQVDLNSLAEVRRAFSSICSWQTVDHAPARRSILDSSEEKLAIRNARCFPSE